MRRMRWLFLLMCLQPVLAAACDCRGTGDLGVVIERADGAVKIVEHSRGSILHTVEGLGDLSHASVVFSLDARHAFVFGRDGGLSKVDLLSGRLVARVLQSGNSIGGAISQDGRLVAVSNYEPGGVKVFRSEDLQQVADIPAEYGDGKRSKTVGLVDAPGNRFVYALYDAGEIHLLDMQGDTPVLTRFPNVGRLPYDGLITPNGRYYLAGLFGEDGLARLDLWHPERGVSRVLGHYGRAGKKLPVYKMPHLEGWTVAGNRIFVPAVGVHAVEVIDAESWAPLGRIAVAGQPVFVMSRPDQRQVWVNFAFPDNQYLQVIDTESLEVIHTLEPGKGVLHMEFTPRGERVWVSVRDLDQVQIYDTATFRQLATLPVRKPSGIFFTHRAHRLGL